MHSASDLPLPSPEARAHSARVVALIKDRLHAAGGWLDFAEFMDLALYAPGLGYYSAGAAKFGPAGDFVTAPEVSPLYARCLARVLAPLLGPDPGAQVLEVGAGSGALAAELIPALAALGVAGRRYGILEVSADLRARQRARLGRLDAAIAARVRWLDDLPREPLRGVILANEVADALPVSRFTLAGGGVLAVGVGEVCGSFAWSPRAATAGLSAAVQRRVTAAPATLPAGYTSELSPRLHGWVGALAGVLEEGVLLIGDYGLPRREYYHPERSDGTLVCHYRHRAHADPFLYPGLQDISAWVDFTAVAEAGEAAGLTLAGYATQAHFLLDAGLGAELAAAPPAGTTGRLRAAAQARTLVLPGEMGERFKIMALTRGVHTVPGFGFRDLRHTL